MGVNVYNEHFMQTLNYKDMKFSNRSRNIVNVLKFTHDTHPLVRRSKFRKLKNCLLNIYGLRTFTLLPLNQ